MEKKIDLKLLLTAGGVIAIMGGFYYTTNLRLATAEGQIRDLQKNNDRLIIVEERLKSVQEKTDLIYEIVININKDN